jgi:hypothetical protein
VAPQAEFGGWSGRLRRPPACCRPELRRPHALVAAKGVFASNSVGTRRREEVVWDTGGMPDTSVSRDGAVSGGPRNIVFFLWISIERQETEVRPNRPNLVAVPSPKCLQEGRAARVHMLVRTG